MGQVLHGSATTTEAVRRAIQHSQESLRALPGATGSTRRPSPNGGNGLRSPICRPARKQPNSTRAVVEEEAVIVAFRRHTLLPLDDCLYALQPTIPHLTRSSLHRCLQRHGIRRLPEVEGDKPTKKKFKTYPIGYFHIDIAEVQTAEGKLYLYRRHRPHQQVRLRPTGQKDRQDLRIRIPRGPDRSRPLQNPYRSHRQRHSVHLSAALCRWPYCPLHDAHVRHALPGERHRAPSHQDQAPMDQRPGRANEPHHQGRHRQTLPLRSHRQLDGISPTSSPPTTSAGGSRPSRASHPTSSSANSWTYEPEHFTLNPLHQMPGLNI